MPDCEIEKRINTAPQKSLHEYLKKYIACENALLKSLFQDESEWVYTAEWFYKNEWIDTYKIYRDFNSAEKALMREFNSKKYIYRIPNFQSKR